jgi:hypothetical protein
MSERNLTAYGHISVWQRMIAHIRCLEPIVDRDTSVYGSNACAVHLLVSADRSRCSAQLCVRAATSTRLYPYRQRLGSSHNWVSASENRSYLELELAIVGSKCLRAESHAWSER